jgi:small subunit ribosomal protein S16
MVVIRLSPAGRKGNEVYKIMVTNKAAKLSGRFIEKVGLYTCDKTGKDDLKIDAERFNFWVSKGAQPSPRLLNLIRTQKIDLGASATNAPAKEAAEAAPKAEKKAPAQKPAKPAAKAAAKKK